MKLIKQFPLSSLLYDGKKFEHKGHKYELIEYKGGWKCGASGEEIIFTRDGKKYKAKMTYRWDSDQIKARGRWVGKWDGLVKDNEFYIKCYKIKKDEPIGN